MTGGYIMKKALAIVLALVLALSFLTACNTASTDSGATASSASSPASTSSPASSPSQSAPSDSGWNKDKTHVIINLFTNISTLTPQKSASMWEWSIMDEIYSKLIKEDASGKILPDLAESWSIAADGMSITFKLHDNVLFHNGDKLTADDVVYTINERIMKLPYAMTTAYMIAGATAVDPTTVTVNLVYPTTDALAYLAGANGYIVNQKISTTVDEATSASIIGSGPYKLDKWSLGEKVDLVEFKDYYGGSNAGIKSATYRVMTDLDTSFISVQTGEIDIFPGPNTADAKTAKDDSRLTVISTPGTMSYFSAMNMMLDLFKDLKVRQAINYATDRDSINTITFDGTGFTDNDLIIQKSSTGWTNDTAKYEYNPEKAKELLKEAGYASGLTIKYSYPENPVGKKVAESLQAGMAAAGITLTLEGLETAAWTDAIMKGNYEMTLMVMGSDVLLPAFYAQINFATTGIYNITKWSDTEVDGWITAASMTLDPAVQKDNLEKVMKRVREQAIYAPMLWIPSDIILDANLQGFEYNQILGSVDLLKLSWK